MHARLRSVVTVVVGAVLVFVGILVLGAGLLFDAIYYSGLPVWLHTVAGLLALAPGLLLLLRAIARLPRRLARLWGQRRAFLLLPLGIAGVLAVSSQIWHALRPLPPVPGASRAAVAYLLEALSLMESRYLHGDQVPWPSVRAAALARIANAKAPRDTYAAIRHALADIHDRHSFLFAPHQLERMAHVAPSTTAPTPYSSKPFGRLTEAHVAYVVVPAYLGTGWGSLYFLNDSPGKAYARALRTLLRDLDAKRPLGWVVDLRANGGGNMWPMLDGLGPLLGEGQISAILMPQWGRRVDTWLVAGRASSGPPWFGGLGLIGPEELLLHTASSPVAVLVGPRTASAGEAVAVAFRGRPNTYFVGAPTAGLATSTMSFSLPDGAELLLAIGYLADRTGRQYEGPIPPDADVPATDDGDEALLVASDWIRSRPRLAHAESLTEGP